ncbi:hypothetical protein HZS_2797 [Henneguya salminicola]|nr:hypothetical protein HZS_2797 [Henneguya salminicola]
MWSSSRRFLLVVVAKVESSKPSFAIYFLKMIFPKFWLGNITVVNRYCKTACLILRIDRAVDVCVSCNILKAEHPCPVDNNVSREISKTSRAINIKFS